MPFFSINDEFDQNNFVGQIENNYLCMYLQCCENRVPKGHLISKCPLPSFGPKYQRKNLTISALEVEKWSNHKIKALYNVFNTINSPYNHM